MLTGILGEKIKMSQRFAKSGEVLPVTEIKAGPVTVVQVKTKDRHGYDAVQLAYGIRKKTTKPILGHLKSAGLSQTPRVLAEIKVPFMAENGDLPKEGEEISVDKIFKQGDIVAVTGISKGKGFAGVMKRWGFSGGPATHGQTDRARAPGSIGQTTTPGRVLRGKKMAGRKGQETVTIKNLQVVEVDGTQSLLVLSGSVSGSVKSILKIEKIGVAKKPFELFMKEETKETNVTEGEREENPTSLKASRGKKENAEAES